MRFLVYPVVAELIEADGRLSQLGGPFGFKLQREERQPLRLCPCGLLSPNGNHRGLRLLSIFLSVKC